MSMFKTEDSRVQEILDSLQGLSREVAELRGERDSLKEERKLTKSASDLRAEIETHKIERSTLQEAHEREVREVKHMVGLEKRRAEFEKDAAIREAKLEVREGAVDTKIEAFTDKLEFVQTQLTEQITYLKDDIIKEVFKRLPVVEVNKNIELTQNGNGNGHREPVEA